jgi:serralysin
MRLALAADIDGGLAFVGTASDKVVGSSGSDYQFGEDGNDGLTGGAGDDLISGQGGNDKLTGTAGDDSLDGGAGAARIEGGAGADDLTGGAGNDAFIFAGVDDIGGGDTGLPNDIVQDFGVGADRLDFARIDAIAGGGNDTFTFIGTDDFSAHAGSGKLRYVQDSGANRTYVEGDIDGDDIADFQLELVGLHTLTAAGAGADIVL